MQWFSMQSAGNSFAVIDGRGKNLDFPLLAKELCAKRNADGFMALGESETADFQMHFYNRDGSRAAMCGNGCRCICRFAWELGLVDEAMTVQTDAGVIPGKRLSESRYQIRLPVPEKIRQQIQPGVDFCVCGVPHAAVETAQIKKEALYGRARALRKELDCNVNFYTRLDGTTVKVLTYERGVEDFTPACGTGCGALAAVLHAAGKLPENCLTAINPGGTLEMEITESSIFQTGKVEILYKGVFCNTP